MTDEPTGYFLNRPPSRPFFSRRESRFYIGQRFFFSIFFNIFRAELTPLSEAIL